jgi:F-type H+-transporting ATPase subunit a
MGLIPGFGSILVHTAEGEVPLLRGANTDINTPLAIAIISFIFVEYLGFASGGWRYIKKFINVGRFLGGWGQLFRGKIKAGLAGIGYGIIDGFVGILEGVSEIFRMFSFTFRLFGNMTGGEILVLMVLFLVPFVVVIPVYGLELLVGAVQALIFSGLTLVFATISAAPHEEEHH